MAVPKFLRTIFGSDDINDADEFDDVDTVVVSKPAEVQKPEPEAPAEVQESVSNELPKELLDAILSVINAQLPPVASQCLDREAQRRYLAEILGQPLADLEEVLRKKALNELTGDRKKMQQELEELRAERKDFNAKREEQKASLLSEQRQRRALSDRNRDLESKITQLDSEIEQHKLTISAMMNKVRVAEVSEEDSRTMRDDMAQLREELNQVRAELAAKAEALAAKEQEITALAEKIAEYESAGALEAALEQRNEAVTADDDTASTQTFVRKSRNRRRKAQTVYTPEDDSMAGIDSVDWLLPGGVPASHVPHAADPDFGYQPPKHAPAPDSEAQLTLFD